MIKLLTGLIFIAAGAVVCHYSMKVLNADFSFDWFDLPDIDEVEP